MSGRSLAIDSEQKAPLESKMGTVHGEELPYIFGAPLVEGFGYFRRTNYTKSEIMLSESIIQAFANFVKSGVEAVGGEKKLLSENSLEKIKKKLQRAQCTVVEGGVWIFIPYS
ncbi:hypothetical protein PV325_013027 [Microctonus aethiopoides]|nr:hypothetical protein PV325_013027 [Microctonus aethiopoides]KAK0092395.1 hypothetical protein PV326_001541 [Microctonus aethiopoides]